MRELGVAGVARAGAQALGRPAPGEEPLALLSSGVVVLLAYPVLRVGGLRRRLREIHRLVVSLSIDSAHAQRLPLAT
ncbi:MAG: hypothetical protein V3T81_05350, partial [Thermoanaerobaculia bacterium]